MKFLRNWGVAILAVAAGLTPMFLGRLVGLSSARMGSPIEAYVASKAPDVWAFDREFENQVEGAPPSRAVAERLTQMNTQVARLLDGNRSATPFTGEIVNELGRRFGRMVTAVHRGGELKVFGDDEGQIAAQRLETAIKLAYVPKMYADVVAQGIGTTIQYNPSSRIVAIPAIQWPDIPLTASLFHELGHAYRHLVTGIDANRTQRSESLALEEVEMHELGGKVFDSMTKGAYSALLKRILDRAKLTKPEQVVGSLTASELSELDTMLGLQGATQTPVRMALAQTCLSLGFMWIDGHSSADAALQKAKFYLWYTEPAIR